ncbi:unnamed protein product [Protopolystoma xenopodis]|uniref:Uncharacterized protein n=1 Tax=Protopolystoma xenopodis TaxID=117903 RepID=A0A3S5BPE8_9PLAT|nr:unnamed protein product [Protopolystoma xenopodis]
MLARPVCSGHILGFDAILGLTFERDGSNSRQVMSSKLVCHFHDDLVPAEHGSSAITFRAKSVFLHHSFTINQELHQQTLKKNVVQGSSRLSLWGGGGEALVSGRG